MNGLLVVDKPSGASSHDVVQWARRALWTKSVGHAGTLDPMATGVLLLLVGEGTKLSSFLTLLDKRYIAEITLGQGTDSLDADGAVIEEAPVPSLTVAEVEAALAPMLGDVEQRAPAVSAIKVDGKALHERVRRGEQVEAPIRNVTLHSAKVLKVEGPRIELEVHCGKGYYVRSLARDLAIALGTVGHLSALRRTTTGPFGLERAVDGTSLRGPKDPAVREALEAQALNLLEACEGMPRAALTEVGAENVRHGRFVSLADAGLSSAPAEGVSVAMVDVTGTLLAIGRAAGTEGLRVARGFGGRS